jgi:16S rRNA (cytidine1402-2'-O)-methyltransferase
MALLNRYAAATATLIFYESCHRIEKFLHNIFDVCGPDRTVSVCRELTKIHETILTAPIGEICKNIEHLTLKGEFVVSIAPQHYNL